MTITLILLENFIKIIKRVDKDYKGQVTTLQGNVDFWWYKRDNYRLF